MMCIIIKYVNLLKVIYITSNIKPENSVYSFKYQGTKILNSFKKLNIYQHMQFKKKRIKIKSHIFIGI